MKNISKSKPEPASSLIDSNVNLMQQENEQNFTETDINTQKFKQPFSQGVQKVGAHLMGSTPKNQQQMEMMPSEDSDEDEFEYQGQIANQNTSQVLIDQVNINNTKQNTSESLFTQVNVNKELQKKATLGKQYWTAARNKKIDREIEQVESRNDSKFGQLQPEQQDTQTSRKNNTINLSTRRRRAKSNLGIDEEFQEGVYDLDKREIMKLKLYKDQIKRDDLPFDKQLSFTQEDLEIKYQDMAREAKFNQRLFLDNFGIDIQIPTFFVIDSFIWQKNTDYIFQIVKYVLPKKRYKTIQHMYDGTSTVSSYQALYSEKLSGNLLLKIMKNGDHALEEVGEIIIRDVETAKIAQSSDGSMLALLTPEVDAANKTHFEIKVYNSKSDDPLEFLNYVENKKYVCRYEENQKMNVIFDFIETLQFDNRNSKLIGWGKQQFLILNIQTSRGLIYEIEHQLFEQILCLTYRTYEDSKRDECILTCKSTGKLQIIVYDFLDVGMDFNDEEMNGEELVFKSREMLKHKLQKKKNGTNWTIQKASILHDSADTNKINKNQNDETWMFPFCVDFYEENFDQFHVKMSSKQECLIVVNDSETFVVDFSCDGCHVKRKIFHMKNKKVHYIFEDPYDSGFYMLCSKNYDQKIELEHTHRQEIYMDFERQVEPGIIKIFDMSIKKTKQANSEDNIVSIDLRFIGMRDDEFNFDRCIFKEKKIRNPDPNCRFEWKYEQEVIKMIPHIFAQISSFCINWPYIAFSGMDDYLCLINVHAQDYLHRVQLCPPGERMRIEHTQITDTQDLIALIHVKNQYRLFQIDLTAYDLTHMEETQANPQSLFYNGERKPIFQYTEEQVKRKKFVQMHCRGSSHKYAVDFDEKFIALLLHEDELYSWVQQNHFESKFKHVKIDSLRKVQDLAKNECKLRIQKDDTIYFKSDSEENKDGKVSQESIKRLTLNFCSYEIETVYVDSDVKDTIQAFDVDQETEKIMIVCEAFGATDNQPFYTFKIYDIQKQIMDFSIIIKSEALVGRLLSGLYTFVNGHIYFNNNVIKIRYDLLKTQGLALNEQTFFNTYYNIFPLSENMRVRSNTPLVSMMITRFAYIIQDKEYKQPKIIRILPYLHDRKIFLNETPVNSTFFYTIIETSVEAEKMFNKKQKDRYINRHKDLMIGRNDALDEESTEEDQTDSSEDIQKIDKYTAIVCISTIESTFDVYLQNGIKINHVNYKQVVERYGEPYTVSSDGTKFIFKQPESNILMDLQQNSKQKMYDDKILIQKYMTFSILHLSIFGFTHVKDVCIMQELKNCLREGLDQSQPKFTHFKTSNRWLFVRDFNEFLKTVSLTIKINNNMDIAVKIQQQSQLNPEDVYDGYQEELHSIYYFEKCGYNLDHTKMNLLKIEEPYNFDLHSMTFAAMAEADQKDPETGKNVNIMSRAYFATNHLKHKFSLNTKYLFFNNKHTIKYFDFNKDFQIDNLKQIGLEIDRDEEATFIQQIRMSSNPDLMGIVLSEDEGSVIFKWDIKANSEVLMHDVQGKFKLLWDDTGEMYILNNGNTFFTDIGCNIKAYKYQDFDKMKTSEINDGLGTERGIRMDSKNHNWMILEEYLVTPFSYMCFVIKNHIETVNDDLRKYYLFDPEPYNYLLNKSSSFLDGNFVKIDPAQLHEVLQQFSIIDVGLLDILVYSQNIKIIKSQSSQSFTRRITDGENSDKNTDKSQLVNILNRVSNIFRSSNQTQHEPEQNIITVTNTPLHMAVREGNNKSVDTLLFFLAKVKLQSTNMFRDIFDELIMFQNMKLFIDNMPVQTNMMLKKQVIKVMQAHSDEIVCMTESNSIYVDNKFYKDRMNERINDSSCSSYPVRVVALRAGWILKTDDHIDGRYFLQEVLRNEDLSYYNLKSLRMLIEFLYLKIKFTIFRLLLPCYLSNITLFIIVAFLNEQLRSSYIIDKENNVVMGSANSTFLERTLLAFLILNFILVMIQSIINFLMFKMMGFQYFKRLWSWIDMAILFISVTILIQFFRIFINRNEQNIFQEEYNVYRSNTIFLRSLLTFGQFVLFSKSQQFLSLIDSIAPLIGIAFQIFRDIGGFLVILVIFLFSFSFAFYILAQNQKNFDGLNEEDNDSIAYGTFLGSINFLMRFLIGETDMDNFSMGNGIMEILLNLVFWGACFIIIILMLNMLIAIMGNTFEVGNETQEQQKYKEHLRFVVDNWFMRKYAFEHIEQVQYIITTFQANEDENNDPQYQEIVNEIDIKTTGIAGQLKKQDDKIKDIQRMLTKLIKQQDPDG